MQKLSSSTMFSILWFLGILNLASTSCPLSENIHPCTCKEDSSDDISAECENVDNEEELQIAMSSLKNRRVTRVTLKGANLQYLPHDIFKDIELDEIDLLESSFFALSDGDDAFEGLEQSLGILTITDCRFMAGWDWSNLKKMKELFRIDILGGDMDSVGTDVSAIHHLPIVDLAFSRNRISWIDDNAFAKYENLKFLSLDYNEISKLKRSMFPNPATNLMYINLGHNQLEHLDDGLFSEMPSLSDLFLEDNLLTTLNEKAFSPIWSQLEFFGATGNPLKCDCRIRWVTKSKPAVNQRVICDKPFFLKGRFVYTLASNELHC